MATIDPVFNREFPPEKPSTALCLSGGGYRAMLFHLGALWRLNESSLLNTIDMFSCVSGGSIVGGYLGLKWSKLNFDAHGFAQRFQDEVVLPLRHLAEITIDLPDIIEGIFLPKNSASRFADSLQSILFSNATLKDLPDKPIFTLNATDLKYGSLWQFSKRTMTDNLGILLANSVAASAAYPPYLSPLVLTLSDNSRIYLTDGGIFDNLGLETAWRKYSTILVSDGSKSMTIDENPHADYIRQTFRVIDILENQGYELRKRILLHDYRRKIKEGTYWGIDSKIENYGLDNPFEISENETHALASIPTRLKKLDATTQEKLINWGFVICDTALRTYYNPKLPKPDKLPYIPNVFQNYEFEARQNLVDQ